MNERKKTWNHPSIKFHQTCTMYWAMDRSHLLMTKDLRFIGINYILHNCSSLKLRLSRK